MPGSTSNWHEIVLLLAAFGLSGLIGLEHQLAQKSAGLRTHTLVGTGSAVFTLVSAYGFGNALGNEVNLDPSRIAAQVVSGVGFLGAGVIFMRRDVVRGLTTAATIWIAAGVGMACGADMVVLACVATALHLITVAGLGRLTRFLPSPDRRRVVEVGYLEGGGVLRQVLSAATAMGFDTAVLGTQLRRGSDGRQVQASLRFRGRLPLRDLVAALAEIEGVRSVRTHEDLDDD